MSTYVFRGIELPDHLKESLDAFCQTGRACGSFLHACIDNNLREACSRADETSLTALPAIVAYLYNECPMGCWGYPGAHDSWITNMRDTQREIEQQDAQ